MSEPEIVVPDRLRDPARPIMLARMKLPEAFLAMGLAAGAVASCADVIHDTEKGVHTTETEIRGSNGAKSVEQGPSALKNDVAGHAGPDAGDGGADAAPSSADTKI